MPTTVTSLATNVEKLKAILADDCRLPDEIDAYTLCLRLLENFRSTDAVLRDEVSYSLLAGLIEAHQRLTAVEREQFLEIALDDAHLFCGIGEIGTDSVFMRTFSVLMIPLVLEPDAKARSLPDSLIHAATERVISYVHAERDVRGYVEGKGWAHSVAHTSDALDACAQHPATTSADCHAIMECVAKLASTPEPLCWGEDNRLAWTASRIIMHERADSDYMSDWLTQFTPLESGELADHARLNNAEQFLRCLYFLIQWQQPDAAVLSQISNRLREVSLFTKYGMVK